MSEAHLEEALPGPPFLDTEVHRCPFGRVGTWLHGQVLVQGKFNNFDLDNDLDLGSLKMCFIWLVNF